MTVKDVTHVFTGNENIKKISVSQANDVEINGCHKGHIVMNLCDSAVALSEKIKALNGVDRIETYNCGTGIMISVAEGSNAFNVGKKIGKILLEDRIITQDEIAPFYRTLEGEIREATYYFENNPRMFQFAITQSDSPDIPGALHKAHISISFGKDADMQDLRALSAKLQAVPGIECTIGPESKKLAFSINPRQDGFAVAKKLADSLLEEGFISHEEKLALNEELDGAARSPVSEGKGI